MDEQDRAPFGKFDRVSPFPVIKLVVVLLGRDNLSLQGAVNNWEYSREDAILGTWGVRYFPAMAWGAKEQPNDSVTDSR